MTSCAVIGAGPVGTTMALALIRAGFEVSLFEREASLPADPRAATLQPPTLEMLSALGTGAEIIAKGLSAPVFQFRDRASDAVLAEYDYGRLEGETPFPFAVQCEQFKVADTNARAIEATRPGTLRLKTAVTGFEQDADGVTVHVETPESTAETLRVDYLIGCDGGRSLTRKALGIAFEGFTYEERFLVLTTPRDFFERGFRVRNYVLDPVQWCALFKVPHEGPPGLWRIVFPAPSVSSGIDAVSDAYVLAQIRGLDDTLTLADITHRNIYAVNQRVAASFRKGRVFLAGDAAHVNNPLGGLGMNSGIHDAVNLAGKLVAAQADPSRAEALFDAYDVERRGIADRYVQAQTIQNKKRLEAKTPEERKAAADELRATCADPDRHFAWVMNASLIAGLNSLKDQTGSISS
ncbi:3-(3-hydroxy-phenyl)propionate hydroxylase [Roseivivax lentus]|uniref:3-(3-hydroxy-phenyl)propionate hydroxylase n=1 Tax=Roseivivax lentus TaxID=633194 RepID=A0A1N7LNP6_9RHOB|nr:FAD-dependent monooxygenase [Roseivivax lentus]SIS75440.1 3-(3-hydroxy-phenyl)propionate hydroxylase [Roseivivax lentus]